METSLREKKKISVCPGCDALFGLVCCRPISQKQKIRNRLMVFLHSTTASKEKPNISDILVILEILVTFSLLTQVALQSGLKRESFWS